MGACCQKPDTSSEEFVDVSFSDRSHRAVDLDTLRTQLNAMEDDRVAQDALFQSLQQSGSVMIATLGVRHRDHAKQLKLINCLRALLAQEVWSKDVSLVKADECKFFVFSASPSALLSAAVKLAHISESFPKWVTSLAPELESSAIVPAVKIGIEAGQVLLLPGDCYGDPVNVASKIGEDLAEEGQLCLGATFAKLARADPSASELLLRLQTTELTTEVSKVELTYLVAPLAAAMAATTSMNTGEVIAQDQALQGLGEEAGAEKVAVFVSDMSGFTSLTKKYGILHYLRLVLNVRSIFEPLIEAHGGKVVKYDGDNIVAVFPTCCDALMSTKKAWESVEQYNRTRTKDFQLRMGCSLCYGEVFLQGEEIHGEAFEYAAHLAEDVSEVQEVLITQRFKQKLEDDVAPGSFKMAPPRLAEHHAHGRFSYSNVEILCGQQRADS